METKKIVALQGLRGCAAIMVFLSHCRFLIGVEGINRLNYLGAGGVSLFIYLSGFLAVYTSKEDPDKQNLFQSYIRKVVKFFPLHFLTFLLALPLCYNNMLSLGKERIVILLSNLFLVHAWIPFSNFYFSVNDVSWYLSLYCFLIIFSSWMIKRIRRLNVKTSIISFFTIVLSQLILFILTDILGIGYSYRHWLMYVCPVTRMLDFFGGGLIYNCLQCTSKMNSTDSSVSIRLCVAGLIILLGDIVCCLFFYNEFFSAVAWSIPSFLVIYGISYFELNKESLSIPIIKALFYNKVLIWIGGISLEFFMIHKLILRYGTEWLDISKSVPILYRLLFYISCFIITIVISKVLNKANQALTNTVRSHL